ncbi:hypothetical protein KIN20_000525 [Parelaphostrongylus tenuis]|uniref:Uncharacterized protein n=1 Tax=Parelaphostrongylus tenuis TaxID=148309 RepID=A0AAD5QDY4_PARTN|nr:hypothetical protein KIN20_000525 [Parelaphostrongylus tenuis]
MAVVINPLSATRKERDLRELLENKQKITADVCGTLLVRLAAAVRVKSLERHSVALLQDSAPSHLQSLWTTVPYRPYCLSVNRLGKKP